MTKRLYTFADQIDIHMLARVEIFLFDVVLLPLGVLRRCSVTRNNLTFREDLKQNADGDTAACSPHPTTHPAITDLWISEFGIPDPGIPRDRLGITPSPRLATSVRSVRRRKAPGAFGKVHARQ